MTYTTTEAAHILDVTRRTIIKHADRVGIPKFGKAYLIDDAGLEKLRRSIETAKPGRPFSVDRLPG